MTSARTCVNCGDALSANPPDGHDYCPRCAAAWTGGPTAASEPTVERGCRNCGAALPASQPAGHDYCDTCAAAWQRGRS